MEAVAGSSRPLEVRPLGRGGLAKLMYAGAFLALATGAIALAGPAVGHRIALAGYTDSVAPERIVVGNKTLAVPANAIRQARARHAGAASRLDLHLRWPQLDGFSEAARADFNNTSGSKRILFLGLAPRTMSRDMSGRLEPVYRALIEAEATPGPAGIQFHPFKKGSRYDGEVLAVAQDSTGRPFAARCLAGADAELLLAPCERDIAIGGNLSLTYRFPRELLANWPELDAALRRTVEGWLEKAG